MCAAPAVVLDIDLLPQFWTLWPLLGRCGPKSDARVPVHNHLRHQWSACAHLCTASESGMPAFVCITYGETCVELLLGVNENPPFFGCVERSTWFTTTHSALLAQTLPFVWVGFVLHSKCFFMSICSAPLKGVLFTS